MADQTQSIEQLSDKLERLTREQAALAQRLDAATRELALEGLSGAGAGQGVGHAAKRRFN